MAIIVAKIGNIMKKNIFENTERAFSLKTDKELDKSIFLFRMMNRPWIVSAGTKLTNFSLKYKLPVKSIIRNTIFRQVCGGGTRQRCVPILNIYIYIIRINFIIYICDI